MSGADDSLMVSNVVMVPMTRTQLRRTKVALEQMLAKQHQNDRATQERCVVCKDFIGAIDVINRALNGKLNTPVEVVTW